jgi:small subunit ribosomal protein S1
MEFFMETTRTSSGDMLEPKTRLTGKVIKTTIAGALVDVGQKVPGVIHISQLRNEPVNRVDEVLKAGEEVTVWVRRVHDDRIELTMIEPLALEWREIKPDMVVNGKVQRLESYGAFIDIGAERPGLVHVSEISHDYVKTPSQVLKEGDEVVAKVLDIDRRKKQIRLSIKAATPKPEETVTDEKPAESRKARNPKKPKKEEGSTEEVEVKEQELTAFQIAFQEAQKRMDGKRGSSKKHKYKKENKEEQEEIFNRTLENRITSN